MDSAPDELSEGEQIYAEANDRMKAHIDAEAELRSGGEGSPLPNDVVDRAEQQGVEPYSESYLRKLRNGNVNSEIAGENYLKTVRYRETKQANDHVSRNVGNVSYEGPPLDMTMQHITERPVTAVNQTNGKTVEITFELGLDDVFTLIREADEEVAREIWDTVVR